MQFELTRQFIEELKVLINNDESKTVSQLIEVLHEADIAEIFNHISTDEAKYIYLLLDGEKAADVLIETEEDERIKLLKQLPADVIARQFIHYMDSDDATDIIAELSVEKKEEVLNQIKDVEQAGDIVELLRYKENTAGGLMAKELVAVNENIKIDACLDEIRIQAQDIDGLYYVYVVDDDNILKGTLSLKKLLINAKKTSSIKNIFNSNVIFVKVETPTEDVSNIMDKYDLVSLPVVDSIGRLVGRITIDDVVDIIREDMERDYQMISGISEDVEHHDKVLTLVRARLPWLFIGLIGEVFNSRIIGSYETQLRIAPEMAFFIPLIAAMGGNVGVQSSSIIVQGLANKTIGLESTYKKLFKELFIASLNGIILSSLIFIFNYFFSDSLGLALTVSVALFSVIIFASIFGTFIPLILDKFKINPAFAMGPFVTTLNDIVGMFIYFLIGRVFYGIV